MKNNSSKIILGAQWGDEGKGKVVDYLSTTADAVIRFQGGHNAGHTLYHNHEKLVLHLIPSGILQNNIQCLIGHGAVVCPIALNQEINNLQAANIKLLNKLFISKFCPLILPTHIAIDKAKGGKIGTTGRGIGPAYEDKAARRGLRLLDLYSPDFADKLENLVTYHNFLLTSYYKQPELCYKEILDKLLTISKTIENYIVDIKPKLYELYNKKKTILFEGAQGTLLDLDLGTYPYVTSSNTIAAAAFVGTGANLHFTSEVLGIFKAYCTRVGNGPFPTEIPDVNFGNEFGSTTGRARRCGWLDLVMLKQAIQVNGINQLVITKLDILDSFANIKICTGYDAKHKPIYQKMRGWECAIGDINDFDDLPMAAKDYIKFIVDKVEVPIVMASNGPNRENILHIARAA